MKRFTYSILALLILWCTACSKEDREIAYANQETRIETFVTARRNANPDIRVEYNNGATRIVLTEGEGPELTARGEVEFYYAGFIFTSGTMNSSTIFATNYQQFADAYGWNITDDSAFGAVKVNLAKDQLLEGLRKGLAGVREGEECYILFSGKYAFGKKATGTIPANAPLAYHILVTGVEN